jgi:hypothetical protein
MFQRRLCDASLRGLRCTNSQNLVLRGEFRKPPENLARADGAVKGGRPRTLGLEVPASPPPPEVYQFGDEILNRMADWKAGKLSVLRLM